MRLSTIKHSQGFDFTQYDRASVLDGKWIGKIGNEIEKRGI